MKPGPGQRIPVFTTVAQVEEHLRRAQVEEVKEHLMRSSFVPMNATEAYEYAQRHGIPPAGNRSCCSPVWSAAPGGHSPECKGRADGDRAPDRMRPEETDAKWFENPRRLPWCAVCNKTIAQVKVTRMPISGDREFIVECHGATERTVLSDREVKAMTGYGRAFAAEGVRDL